MILQTLESLQARNAHLSDGHSAHGAKLTLKSQITMLLWTFRLSQLQILTAQQSLHLRGSKWLWHVQCQHTFTAISIYTEKIRLHVMSVGINIAFFLRFCRFSDSVNNNYSVTIPLPGTRCSCAVASVGAQGHSGARSDFTAAELSVPQWELMYNVRCQVVLCGSQKEDSIVCESPGHCHTTSLASRRDGLGTILKWSNSLSR